MDHENRGLLGISWFLGEWTSLQPQVIFMCYRRLGNQETPSLDIYEYTTIAHRAKLHTYSKR